MEVGPSVQQWRGLLQGLVLALLVFIAAALRLYDVNWDQFQHVHPDESFIVWVADTIAWPGSLSAALDPERSTLNPFRWPPADSPASKDANLAGKPRNYAYGHFPLYLLVTAAHLGQSVANWLGANAASFPGTFQPIHVVGRNLTRYDYLPLVGRVLSALVDMGTLILVYFLTRQLVQSCTSAGQNVRSNDFGRSAGQGAVEVAATNNVIPLLAAAAYACAVLPIQLSHFATVDALLTFFVTASVALAVRTATKAALRTNSESANSESANGESANGGSANGESANGESANGE